MLQEKESKAVLSVTDAMRDDPQKTGIQLETGAEYWAFIDPSNPWDGIPGLIGGEGRTYIAFAVRDP